MNHKTHLVESSKGFQVRCSVCGLLPGIYFTKKKGNKSAKSHEATYNEKEIGDVRSEIEDLAKNSISWQEFHDKAISSSRLLKLVGGERSLELLIQHSEAGMLLD